MKKWLLLFIAISFTSGCVWYDDTFHHDNGRHCGQRADHCGKGNPHNRGHDYDDDDDHHDNGHHKNKKHHD